MKMMKNPLLYEKQNKKKKKTADFSATGNRQGYHSNIFYSKGKIHSSFFSVFRFHKFFRMLRSDVQPLDSSYFCDVVLFLLLCFSQVTDRCDGFSFNSLSLSDLRSPIVCMFCFSSSSSLFSEMLVSTS